MMHTIDTFNVTLNTNWWLENIKYFLILCDKIQIILSFAYLSSLIKSLSFFLPLHHQHERVYGSLQGKIGEMWTSPPFFCRLSAYPLVHVPIKWRWQQVKRFILFLPFSLISNCLLIVLVSKSERFGINKDVDLLAFDSGKCFLNNPDL